MSGRVFSFLQISLLGERLYKTSSQIEETLEQKWFVSIVGSTRVTSTV